MTATSWGIPGATNYRALVNDILDRDLASYATDSFDLKPFIGDEGDNSIIVRKTQLSKEAGDTIKIGMEGFLNNVPYFGDRTIEQTGEEQLLFYDQAVYVNQMRNAVIDAGAASRQRDPFNAIKRAAKLLGEYYARELTREIFYASYYGWSPNVLAPLATYQGLGTNSGTGKPARYWYMANEEEIATTYSATDATFRTNITTAESQLTNTASCRMCPAIIEGLATKARVANMRPAKINGMSAYVLILHPYQVNQLRRHSDWFKGVSDALPRSKDNPIFTYSSGLSYLGMWAGIAIYESNFIHSANESRYNDAEGVTTIELDSDNDNVRRAIFWGANAIAFAEAKKPKLIRKDDIDYYNLNGVCVAGIAGAARAFYTSDDGNSTIVDQGTIIVSTYSPATVLKGD